MSISEFEIDGGTDRGEEIHQKASGGGIVMDLDSSTSSDEVFYSAVVQKPR